MLQQRHGILTGLASYMHVCNSRDRASRPAWRTSGSTTSTSGSTTSTSGSTTLGGTMCSVCYNRDTASQPAWPARRVRAGKQHRLPCSVRVTAETWHLDRPAVRRRCGAVALVQCVLQQRRGSFTSSAGKGAACVTTKMGAACAVLSLESERRAETRSA